MGTKNPGIDGVAQVFQAGTHHQKTPTELVRENLAQRRSNNDLSSAIGTAYDGKIG